MSFKVNLLLLTSLFAVSINIFSSSLAKIQLENNEEELTLVNPQYSTKKCSPFSSDVVPLEGDPGGQSLSRIFPGYPRCPPPPPQPCPLCDKTNCNLPKCKCSNLAIPGGLGPKNTPQIVIVTTQSAVNNQTYTGFRSLFQGLVNPNNCPATGTYFVSHEFTDYFYVQSLLADRHEIGDNTVTSTGKHDQEYWKTATAGQWKHEIKDQATILRLYANTTNVRGFRAPYLQPGGDNQANAMQDWLWGRTGYDSTRVTVKFSRVTKQQTGILWPYTYDYQSTQDCVTPPCPKQCFKGLWEIPMHSFWDRFNNSCATLDACNVVTYNDVFRLLHDRFKEHYMTNRAPFIISMGPQWLSKDFIFKGLRLFLEYLGGYDSVYIVSAGQALDWIRAPTPLSNITSFTPWRCDGPAPYVCKESQLKSCSYDNKRRQGGSYYSFRSCATGSKCPKCYPWLGDTTGTKC